MDSVTPTAFWAAMTITASAIGGSFFFGASHAGEPRHPEAAPVEVVTELKVKVQAIESSVQMNRYLLDDVKNEIREMRVEQSSNMEIVLDAIDGGGRNGN